MHEKRIDDIVAKLKARAAEAGEGAVITDMGHDDTLVSEMRHPTREDLDRASTDVPIIISPISGHLVVGNSKALDAAGITGDTPNPDGGRIEKNDAGEPSGVMEGNATGRMYTLVSPSLTRRSARRMTATIVDFPTGTIATSSSTSSSNCIATATS